MAMTAMMRYLPCLLLLSCLDTPAEGRRLHFGSCAVSVYTHELRNYYNDLRQHALAEDREAGIRFLKGQEMRTIEEGQSCCFLRLLLRFYVERVFNQHSSQPQHQRSTSALANAFITIRRDLRLCHCQCGEDTQRKLDSLHAEFMKIDVRKATVKAVGELNTLLDWLDGFSTHTSSR